MKDKMKITNIREIRKDLKKKYHDIDESCGNFCEDGNRGPFFSIRELSDNKYIGCIGYDNHQFKENLKANYGHEWKSVYFNLDHWPNLSAEYFFRWALKGDVATQDFRKWCLEYTSVYIDGGK